MRIAALFLMLLAADARAALVKKSFPYKVGNLEAVGYLVFDDKSAARRPGVLIAPEWWGISQHEKDAADKLAELGYVALVIDLYGKGQTADAPEKAKALMEAAQKAGLDARFTRPLELLRQQRQVDPKRIAAVGYGLGGGLVLDQARLGRDLRGVVSYYGGLVNKDRVPPKSIAAEVLVLVGDGDVYVDKEQIDDFESEMRGLKARAKVVRYKAYHGFANKAADPIGIKYELPFAYDEEIANKAWSETVAFLKRVL